MTLTRDMIAMDVDYEQLGFIESHLMHEVKRLGEREFVEKYKDTHKWKTEFNLDNYGERILNAIVMYYSNIVNIEIEVDLKEYTKYILDSRDALDIEELSNEEFERLIKELEETTFIKEFIQCGLLYSEICEAV